MPEPRPLASLTAGLLARKGHAQPAIRPAFAPRPVVEHRVVSHDRPAVIVQQERLAAAFPVAATASGKRIALTLRIDGDRHLRLKLLAARRRSSIQTMFVDLLDEMLDESVSDDCVCGAGER